MSAAELRSRLRGLRIGTAILAAAVVIPTVGVLTPVPASAIEVFRPPASIDNTGVTDVSDALSNWIATGTRDGTAGAPNVIALDGTYRVDYGLAVGNASARSRLHPGLVPYTRNHVVLDLTRATLVQKDATPFSHRHKILVEPRKRYGTPVLRFAGGSDIRVEGGHLLGTNRLGHYSVAREPWHGVTIVGTHDLVLHDLHIEGVWGDFVYVNHDRTGRASNVLVDGGRYERNGRQGITFNAVDGLEIRDVDFRNVQRILFDHEPDRRGGATHVYIHDNTGNSGGLGYLNLRPLGVTPLADITVSGNHLSSGHFKVTATAANTPRARFTFTNNTTDSTKPYAGGYRGRVALITLGGKAAWSDVTIRGNHDLGRPRARAIAVSSRSTHVVTAPNGFAGFARG